MNEMNEVAKQLLKEVSGLDELPKGAYNIRDNSQSVARQSSENIQIVGKEDKSGIDIIVKPGTKAENVYIPALVSCSGVHDLVYNAFGIGLATKLLMDLMNRLDTNSFFINMIGGVIASTVAVTASGLGLTTQMDTIIIGSIMTLVPGLVITNAIRDIIAGDYLSGLTKGVEALLIAAAIAAGVAVPLSLLRPFWGG